MTLESAPEFWTGNSLILQGLGFGTKLLIFAQRKSGGFYFQPMPFIYTPAF
jgi:hypothetical protein